MADKEHLSILERGVEQWNQWRKDHREIKPDLSGARLRDADLRLANLSEANLSEADFRLADLCRADLRWADLSGARLDGAILRWADLTGADLSDANLATCDDLTLVQTTRARISARTLLPPAIEMMLMSDDGGQIEAAPHGAEPATSEEQGTD
jgi:Pentapeptide repeats (8 copies)